MCVFFFGLLSLSSYIIFSPSGVLSGVVSFPSIMCSCCYTSVLLPEVKSSCEHSFATNAFSSSSRATQLYTESLQETNTHVVLTEKEESLPTERAKRKKIPSSFLDRKTQKRQLGMHLKLDMLSLLFLSVSLYYRVFMCLSIMPLPSVRHDQLKLTCPKAILSGISLSIASNLTFLSSLSPY